MLEKTLESPLDCKEIQPVHPKGNQSWIFIGRTDAEAQTPILWPPDAKNWLIGKDSDAGKDLRQEEKGPTGWDGWMESPTQWTWVWVNSGSWWWTGRPGMLWFMGLQRVRQDWVTELKLNWNTPGAKKHPFQKQNPGFRPCCQSLGLAAQGHGLEGNVLPQNLGGRGLTQRTFIRIIQSSQGDSVGRDRGPSYCSGQILTDRNGCGRMS